MTISPVNKSDNRISVLGKGTKTEKVSRKKSKRRLSENLSLKQGEGARGGVKRIKTGELGLKGIKRGFQEILRSMWSRKGGTRSAGGVSCLVKG